MTVTIQTSITRSIPAEGVYRISLTVVNATGISLDVLVFNTEHDVFSHVCSVYDLESYPVGRDAAQLAGLQFYRGRSVVSDWATINDATAFETVSSNRLKVLAVAWDSIVTSFSGSETETVTSDAE